MLRLFPHNQFFLEEDSSSASIPQELFFVNEAFSDSMRWEVGKMLGSLIKVANKTLVIAERGDHVTLLSEFPPNTDLNTLLQQDQKKTPSPRGEILSGFLKQFKDKK